MGCSQTDHSAATVTRPRQGGDEIDAPPGGFRALAGQTIYVPAYSSIFTADRPQSFNLAITLSIRNTDQNHPIIVTSVRYFDHGGKLVHDHLQKPLRIAPMAALEFFVTEKDTRGGISASFLVEWLSENMVTAPLAEAIMVGTAGGQGVSFTSQGRVLSDRTPPIGSGARKPDSRPP